MHGATINTKLLVLTANLQSDIQNRGISKVNNKRITINVMNKRMINHTELRIKFPYLILISRHQNIPWIYQLPSLCVNMGRVMLIPTQTDHPSTHAILISLRQARKRNVWQQWQRSHCRNDVNREPVVLATICNNYCEAAHYLAKVRFSWQVCVTGRQVTSH